MGQFLPAIRRSRVTRAADKVLPAQLGVEQKTILTSYFNALMQAGGMHERTRPWPVERAVAEGYDRVMWVFRAVNTIATDSARLPYRLREGDDGDPLDDHPLYRLLNKKANPLESGQVFRKRLSAQVLLSKAGAFVEKTHSNGGTLIRVDLLPPGRTVPVPGTGNDLIDHWELTRLDGSKRALDYDKVLWFRDPHPLDPYSGTTALESAGMSVELDYFSRLYNVMFMRNDGRPATLVGVDPPTGPGAAGDMDPTEMDRLEARFGKGPLDAGRTSVVSGRITVADLAARPRDMQYGTTSKNSKTEILSAFGTPESIFGYAADRTYANADAELYVYWTRTMPGHNDIIVAGFDEDSADELTGYLDTTSIPILERGERERRSEARDEFQAGLRSIISYAQLAGYEDEIESTPHTRALFISQGRTPLPATAADAEALGLGQPEEEGAPGTAEGAVPGVPGAPPGEGEQTGSNFEPPTTGAPTPPGGPSGPPRTVSPPTPPRAPDASDSVDRSVARPNLRVVGGKARYHVERNIEHKARVGDRESEPDPRVADRLEDTVAAALAALGPRWVERAVARLESPKARKGTRHWQPVNPDDTRVGNKALDTAKAVDEERWADEAEAQVSPLVTAAAVAAAAVVVAELSDDDEDEHDLAGLVAATVGEVVGFVRNAAATLARRLVVALNDADQAGETMPELATVARAYMDRVGGWAANTAVTVATATINGSRDAAAAELAGADTDGNTVDVVRTWVSRRDLKVRETHQVADAERQTRGIGEPFLIGGVLLRYPGDPLGPPREIANCFVDGTVVQVRGVNRAYRREYQGDLATVRASGVDDLTCTPNHPVLTLRGWLPAHALVPGDHLVGSGFGQDVGVADPDIDGIPARIEEVVDALKERGPTHRAAGSRVDFHGDGTESDVEVVPTDRLLRVAGESPLFQPGQHEPFPGGDLLAPGASFGRQLGLAGRRSASGAVSGGGVGAALLDRPASGHEPVRLDLAARLAACFDQPLGHSGTRYGQLRRELLHAGASQVTLHEVTDVEVEPGGHVMVSNFETGDGLYIANGIVSHNCRCHLRHRSRATGRFVARPVAL